MAEDNLPLPLDLRPTGKRCNRCRKEKPLTQFHFRPEEGRHRAECKDCYRAAMNARRDPIDNRRRVKEWQQANPEKRRVQNKKHYTVARSDLRRCISMLLRSRRPDCRKRGIEFTITPDDVVALFHGQSGRCALTGRELQWGGRGMQRDTLSIDRIDQSRGYIIGNIRLVTYQANFARNQYSDTELFEFCEAVIAWRDRRA